uniref:Uncharacterized protein n=1 Tax=Rhizophora mucronata TaxID=61149 RepID=A0A2P2NNN2_RHIMU
MKYKMFYSLSYCCYSRVLLSIKNSRQLKLVK